MDASNVNPLAILAATVAAFVIGGLWYSPALFGKVWMPASGFTEADLQRGSQARIFAIAFVFTLIMAANLAMFLAAPETPWLGAPPPASWRASAG
jgi:hypothetical protein